MPFIIRSRNSHLVLDVPDGSSENGVQIQQFRLHGDGSSDWPEVAPNQQWEQLQLANGFYLIVNLNSGKALDVSGGSVEPGAPIIQHQVHGGYNQQWRRIDVLHKLGTPPIYRYISRHSNMALDVAGGSMEDQAPIIQYLDHGGYNQQWEVLERYVRYPNKND